MSTNTEPSLEEILAGKTFVDAAPVGGDGDAVKLEVGESFVGTYQGTKDIPSKFNPAKPSKLHSFVGTDGKPFVWFGKGNGNWQMEHVSAGQLTKVERTADETLDNGFVSSSFKVQTAR